MRFLALALAAIAFLIFPAHRAGAQQRDFSGTWIMDKSQSSSGNQTETIGPVALVIRMTPSELIIDRKEGNSDRVVHYDADGGDTISSFETGKATGHMRWDGLKLITETVYDMRGIPINVKETRSLSSDGRQMTVQSELLVVHGFQGQNPSALKTDSNSSVGTDIYVRQ